MRDQSGSASVMVVGLLAALMITTAAAAGVCGLFVVKQRVSAAADAAALAAADVVIGRVPGVPCERADRAVRLGGARLVRCTVEESAATVEAEIDVAGISISVLARAGASDIR